MSFTNFKDFKKFKAISLYNQQDNEKIFLIDVNESEFVIECPKLKFVGKVGPNKFRFKIIEEFDEFKKFIDKLNIYISSILVKIIYSIYQKKFTKKQILNNMLVSVIEDNFIDICLYNGKDKMLGTTIIKDDKEIKIPLSKINTILTKDTVIIPSILFDHIKIGSKHKYNITLYEMIVSQETAKKYSYESDGEISSSDDAEDL